MPANLPPQYLKAEERFREAKTREEKLDALEEMYALIPKHKGTEKMRADIKRRMSKLRQSEGKKGVKQKDMYFIRQEGGGQATLIGAPNTGKSLLVNKLTGARAESAPYPFTTLVPLPGMMPYEDIQIQLIDTPALTADQPRMAVSNLLRSTDIVLIVADLASPDPAAQVAEVAEVARLMHVALASAQPEPEAFETPADMWKKALVLANKCDTEEEDALFELFADEVGERFACLAVSAATGRGLEALKERVFRELDVVRIYTKEPGRPPDKKTPFVLKRGSNLMDLARMVHKDFADNLKFARIWGRGKYDGQKVQRDHEMRDGDIVELHI